MTPNPKEDDKRAVFFVDIDNCLYSKNTNIQHLMSELIDRYFERHLSLSQEDAYELHKRYYTEYGLAIEGLVRHHKVDALEYNREVDDALPLEDILKPDPKLRQLLETIDRTTVKLWLLTNAYVTHGRRVVKLLGIEDLFEGITYCNYSSEKLVAKPQKEMFEKAMRESGAEQDTDCYFVDDSYMNAKAGQDFGWTSVHLVEPPASWPRTPASAYQIRNLDQLREILPRLFKSTTLDSQNS